MTLSAQAAPIRGSDYHHAIGWLWACRMLDEPDSILSVSVEDSDGGAFDDVVVRRTVRPDIYIQAKSSNYGNEIVDSEWLLTSRRPNGKSPLQHFYRTYCDLVARGGEFALEFWTNRGFDHKNPLLGELLDRKHEKIATERMLLAGPMRSIGKERDRWVTHLEITAEDLAEFLTAVRWKYAGSELEIRENTKPVMKLAGLQHDDRAIRLGVSIVREWVSDGLGPQCAADVVRQAEAMGLVTESGGGDSASESAGESTSEAAHGLPPGCRTCIEALLLVSPDDAHRVASELNQPSSRIPGVLTCLVDNPPQWLREANGLAWDAIVEFATAHELPGSDALREKAVEQGSSRGALYRVRAAVQAADEEDFERARELLKPVPEEYPLLRLARARIDDGDRAVVGAVRESGLHECRDPDIALFAIVMLVVAYCRLDDQAQALAVLRDASQRFPERAGLHLRRADLILSSAVRRSSGGTGHSSLLRSAVTDALEARDRFRDWGGPSDRAVVAAATALLLLNEHERVCELAACSPDGEATRQEARHPEVIECLAEALLVLNRRDQLDKLDVGLLEAPERAHLLALRAHRRGDPDALRLMRDALEQATDDRTRLRAHHGLALFGELDEAALAQVSTADEAYKDLIRAMAHFHREDFATAVSILRPHHRDSLIHAELLANVQRHSGATEDAIETLKNAAEAQGAPSLYLGAVHMLMDQGRLTEAEMLALTALAGDVSPSSELGLRLAVVDIAGQLRDWVRMELLARALFNRFPEAPLAPWAVVQALVGQERRRLAWDFMVEHDVTPIDEPTAQLALQVYSGTDAADGVAERLLDIANTFAEYGEVAGAALAALMAKGDQITLTDTQRSLLTNMVNSYVERFPESEVLRAFNVDAVENLLEVVESVSRSQAVQLSEVVNHVRNGQVPYGVLVAARVNPYAELLLSLSAGYLTAISPNDARREVERRVARDAIAGDVAVDTSVAAVGIRSGLPLDTLTTQFRRVFIADELVYDARAMVLSASLPVVGYAGHFPAAGGLSVTQITEQQRQQINDEAARLVEIMHGWHSAPSARLRTPLSIGGGDSGVDENHLRPWDASLRVAAEKQCVLWCDDLALRELAESVGIRTFGSYALCEVLDAEPGTGDLPTVNEIKAQLLRSGIADVPLTREELSAIASADDSTDLAAIRFLDRPLSWARPQLVLEWYASRVGELASDPDRDRLVQLVRAACCGRGMAVEPANREAVMGEVLATTLNAVRLSAVDSAERIPGVLEAGEYASRQVVPSGSLHILQQALTILYNGFVAQFGPTLASAILREKLFARTSDVVRNTLAAVILGAPA